MKIVKYFYLTYVIGAFLLLFISTIDGFGVILYEKPLWTSFLTFGLLLGFYVYLFRLKLGLFKRVIWVIISPLVYFVFFVLLGIYIESIVLRTFPRKKYFAKMVVVGKNKWRHHGMHYRLYFDIIAPEGVCEVDSFRWVFSDIKNYEKFDIRDTVKFDLYSKGCVYYLVPPLFR